MNTMSASALADLLAQLNQSGQGTQALEATLTSALDVLTHAQPGLSTVQAHLRTRGGFRQVYPQGAAAAAEPLGAESVYAQVIAAGEPRLLPDGRYVLPLTTASTSYGVLDVQWTAEADDEATAWLGPVVQQIASTMENRQLTTLLQRQVRLSGEINTTSTFEALALIVARAFLQQGQFISIMIFDRDAADNVMGMRVIASANREHAYAVQERVPFEADDLEEFYLLVNGRSEIFIDPDNDTEGILTPRMQTWIRQQKVRATYQAPLRTAGRTYGVLAINDTRDMIYLTPAERQVFRSLADQVAVAIENRNLLRRTEDSLSETSRLYEVISALIQAADIPDVLRVIRQYIGQDADSINLTDITYDAQGQIAQIIVRTTITASGEITNPDSDIAALAQPDDLRGLLNFWQRANGEVEIIEDVTQQRDDYPLKTLRLQQNILSSITIPVYDGDQRRAQIILVWSQPQQFDQRTRRLVRTIQSQATIVLRNRQLLAEIQASVAQTQQQVRLLQLLNEIASKNEAEQDETTLLQSGAEALVTATGFDHASIFMLEVDRRSALLTAEYPGTRAFGLRLSSEGGLIQRLRESHQPLPILNVASAPQLAGGNRQVLQRLGTQSVLFMPMFDLQGDLLCIVSLESYSPLDAFDADQVRLASSVVAQIVVGLQRLLLLNNSQRQAAQMQQITLFSQRVQSSLDLQEILRLAVQASRDVLDFDYLTIRLPQAEPEDEAMPNLRIMAHYLVDELQHDDDDDLRVDAGPNTLVTTAWQTQQLVEVDDLRDGGAWQHPLSDDLRSMMALPIVARGERLGLIEVGKREAYAYLPTDRAALQQLANQLGVTLGNAEAYRQMDRLARNKALANEISARLQQQLDIPTVVTMTLQELGQALGAKRGRIRLGLNPQINNHTDAADATATDGAE